MGTFIRALQKVHDKNGIKCFSEIQWKWILWKKHVRLSKLVLHWNIPLIPLFHMTVFEKLMTWTVWNNLLPMPVRCFPAFPCPERKGHIWSTWPWCKALPDLTSRSTKGTCPWRYPKGRMVMPGWRSLSTQVGLSVLLSTRVLVGHWFLFCSSKGMSSAWTCYNPFVVHLFLGLHLMIPSTNIDHIIRKLTKEKIQLACFS